MYDFLKLFWDMCLFKKGPQDIPASNLLRLLLIIVYAGINFLLLILSTQAFNALLQIAVGVLLILGLSKIILYAAKKPERYPQTASALIGIDVILSFISLPAMASLVGQGTMLPFLAIVLLMIWHWAIAGHVFSQALNQPFIFGLGVSFLYVLTSYQVMGLIFPELIISD